MEQSYRRNHTARGCVWVITRSYQWAPVKELMGQKWGAPYPDIPWLLFFPSDDAQSMWVVPASCCLSKQAPGDSHGTAWGVCPATTASAMATELGWERQRGSHNTQTSSKGSHVEISYGWSFALPHSVKGKFHTDFATNWISFPQSWMWCLPPALQSLST